MCEQEVVGLGLGYQAAADGEDGAPPVDYVARLWLHTQPLDATPLVETQAHVDEDGRFEVRESGSGSLARVVVVMGLVDQALRLSGARDVDVRLVSATALGDDADIVEATWAS